MFMHTFQYQKGKGTNPENILKGLARGHLTSFRSLKFFFRQGYQNKSGHTQANMDSSFVQAKRMDISTARMPFTVIPPQAQLLG